MLEDDRFTYLYDGNGNLESKTEKATSQTTNYTYNAQNQLVRIDFPGANYAAYRYDAIGRRIEKDVNGAVTRYVYDGSAVLLEYDDTDTLVARYSHGDLVDQPLTMERGGQFYYFHSDQQGSITQLTDSSGTVVNEYEYDAYGRKLSAVEGVTQPYGYTGREYEAESGHYYYRARYYDPDAGRFLKTDPIGFTGGDLNLYRYV